MIVQPLYSMIIWLILLLAMTAMLIFPNIYWKSDPLIWKIIFNVGFSVMALLCAYAFLHFVQIAVISQNGITIKNIFGNIAYIKWETIVSITKEKLVTYNSRGNIYLNWLVIKTDNSQTAIEPVTNKRNIAPWHIKATDKNIAIIEEYLKNYRPDLHIKNK